MEFVENDKCLKRHGLQLIEINKADVRNQSGNPVKGLLIVAIKREKEEDV